MRHSLATSTPKVFGIGLNKTGTTTLGACLRILGYRHKSYSSELMKAYATGRIGDIIDAAEHFDSFEDWPWPLVWRELYWRYGEQAKFVLTTRASAQIWLESLKRHSLNTHPSLAMRRFIYGHYYPHGYEGEHMAAYERHNGEVRAFFAREAPGSLLEVCWERGDGWPELCAFLGQPRPAADFPHIRPRETGVDPSIRAQNEKNIWQQLETIRAEGLRSADTRFMRGSWS